MQKWKNDIKVANVAVWGTLGAFKHEKLFDVWKAPEVGYNLGTIVRIYSSISPKVK